MRIGICEDEEIIRKQLSELIAAYPTAEPLEISTFAGGEAMLSDPEGFDLVFLDIELGEGVNGLAVAQQLQARPRRVLTIFVTSYQKYVYDAFHLDTFQYLFKPIDTEHFALEFERCLKRYHGDQRYYTIHCFGEEIRLALGEILYIEVSGRKLAFYVKGQEQPYQAYGRLKEVEKALLPHQFAKCNQGCLINLRYVFGGIAEDEVCLTYTTAKGRRQIQLSVSRRQRKELDGRMKRYILEGGQDDAD